MQTVGDLKKVLAEISDDTLLIVQGMSGEEEVDRMFLSSATSDGFYLSEQGRKEATEEKEKVVDIKSPVFVIDLVY